MVKRWIVELAAEERTDLEALTRRGEAPVRNVAHARALLLADDGLPDAEIALRLGRSESFVERTRKRFVQNGPEDALSHRPRPGAQSKLDDRGRLGGGAQRGGRHGALALHHRPGAYEAPPLVPPSGMTSVARH